MNLGPALLLDYFVMLICGNANKYLPSVELIELFICVLYHFNCIFRSVHEICYCLEIL